jgi:hypothetical protein
MIASPPPASPSPGIGPLFAPPDARDAAGHRHRQLIGYCGLFLPLAVHLAAVARRPAGPARWEWLDSISAYYHTGAVAVFVGVLVALSLLLVTYGGYRNESQWLDRRVAIIAGVAAFGVAFFPTAAPPGTAAPSWWTEATGTIHYVSAAVLFAAFAVFDLVLFPKSDVPAGQRLPPDKRWRNRFYRLAGTGIVLAMVWVLVARRAGRSIFWAEAAALACFALSWLVKGRADRTAVALARLTGHYGRHPMAFVRALRAVVRG